MARLPFFIAPLSSEQQRIHKLHHTARGFCWLLTSPPEEEQAASRSMLDLPLTLGLLHASTAGWMPPVASHQALPPGYANQILTLAARYWRRRLHALDLNTICLLFESLAPQDQTSCLQLATQFLTTTAAQRHSLMKPSDTLPADIMQRLETSLAALEASLLEKDAMMPQHLRNTHSLLISYPETVHLLEDHEIARIIDAAELHTKTEIVKAVAKGSSAGGSRKKVSVADL